MAKLIVNGQQILGDCALDADLSQLKKIYGDDAEISVMPDASEKAAMDAATRKQAQLAGVEFTDPVSGKTVMASATGDDQAGLSAIFLKHSLAFYNENATPTIDYSPVTITKSQPAKRVYGAEADKQEAAKHD